MKLDTLDKKILLELDKNSRTPVSRLAKVLKQGRDKVEYRVERLEREHVIKKYTATVNLYKLGYYIYKTYYRIENNKKTTARFLTYLREHPQVYWIAKADGSFDILMAVFAKNANEFHQFTVDILSRFNQSILDYRMYTIIDMWVFHKHYFFGNKTSHVSIGGAPKEHAIDELDTHILRLLSENARISNVDIADRTNSSPTVVSYRIEQLEKKQILLGYPIELNYKALGMLFFKTQLFLRSFDMKLRMEFLDFCMQHPRITFCIRQLGDCMVEIEIEAANYEQYNEIIEEIRTRFAKLIRNFHSMLIKEIHFSWMPDLSSCNS